MSFLDSATFSTIISHTPLISIDLIVRNDAGEILLGKRLNAPARGYWFTPGGRIYKDESLKRAFERITTAELGITIPMSDATFHGVYEHFYEDSVFDDHTSTHYVVLAYTITTPHSSLATTLPTNIQHNTYRWQSIDSLLADESVHTHVKCYFPA